jgi:hypothetical protein
MEDSMIIIESRSGSIMNVDYVGKGELATIIGIRVGSDNALVLGAYGTNERAKEVMAEIENHIKRKYAKEQMIKLSKVDLTLQETNIFAVELKNYAIYTMPKE